MTENLEYLELVRLIEQAGRRLHDAIELALRQKGFNLNAEQALILFGIGDQAVAFTEIAKRGYYLGSNASYNTKKLVDAGLLAHGRQKDRRRVSLSLTEAGQAIRAAMSALFEAHAGSVTRIAGVKPADANDLLERLDSFWRGLVV